MGNIKLEEIIKQRFPNPDLPEINQFINGITWCMKESCKQVLELAAENAECKEAFVSTGDDSGCTKQVVDKQSILDVINLIE